MAFKVGQVISGHYRIVSWLGYGSMGSTFIAEDERFARRVKIETFQDSTGQRLRDIEALIELNHPNILRTRGYGTEAKTDYLVTDYPATIQEFRDAYRKGTIIPSDRVVSYTKQAASALDYIHAQGIVHGDVKPESMYVKEGGRNLVLNNFGLLTTKTGRSTVIGSPSPYMAPEQILGQVLPVVDQYSLAVVVYEWLSGRVPFVADSLVGIFLSHINRPIPPLNSIVPTLPSEVEDVVQRALAKNPRDRFNNVSEFAEKLEQAFEPSSTTRTQFVGVPNPSVPPPQVVQGGAVSPPGAGQPYPENPYGANTREERQRNEESQEIELSLLAIARAKLEDDDRAIVDNIYRIEAGISQQHPEGFYGQRFQLRVQDLDTPLPFDILLHASENVVLLDSWYQHITYNPRSLKPELISCNFRLRAEGKNYVLINFYRERQWLKTIRFEFESIKRPVFSSSS